MHLFSLFSVSCELRMSVHSVSVLFQLFFLGFVVTVSYSCEELKKQNNNNKTPENYTCNILLMQTTNENTVCQILQCFKYSTNRSVHVLCVLPKFSSSTLATQSQGEGLQTLSSAKCKNSPCPPLFSLQIQVGLFEPKSNGTHYF